VNQLQSRGKVGLLREETRTNDTADGARDNMMAIEEGTHFCGIPVRVGFIEAEIDARVVGVTCKDDLFLERKRAATKLRAVKGWTDTCHRCSLRGCRVARVPALDGR
jgi:hypothetical protein